MPQATVNTERTTPPSPKSSVKRMKIVVAVAAAVLVFVLVVGGFVIFLLTKVSAIRASADLTMITAREAYDALKTQNLPLTNEKLTKLDTELKAIETQVQAFSWTRSLPFVSAYYQDSERVFQAAFAGIRAAKRAVSEIEPYADVLGFQGQGSFTGGTAEERIAKILETLQKVTPALDAVAGDLKTVTDSLSGIDEHRYPESLQGRPLRSQILQAKTLTNEAYVFLSENRQAVELLPEIAGANSRKKYLVLFQNSGELRPTGGFLTAYAVINVERGKVQPEGSGDIYELDQKFTDKPPIPAILKRFLTTESRWNLRDMNLSPDFKTSMETFNANYQKIRGQKATFDGIIAVDTHFLEGLVAILGPVEVPGYGRFSADNDKRCDCPQIIYALSEIIDRPTPYIRENRKGILGPMMASILQKSYSAPKTMWPALFQTGWKDIQGKHIQFYFLDPKLQAAAEAIHAAGRVRPIPEGNDYYFQVDTNLAGAKSNFFVSSETRHVVELPTNGKLKRTVTTTYKNPFRPSNCNLEAGQLCLNGILQNWVRVYLPKGTTLDSSRGFDEGSVKVSEEFDRVVVEGTFRLSPLSQAKTELVYSIPYTETSTYSLFFQKQGGTDDIPHILDVNGVEHEIKLDKDQEFSVKF